MNDNINKEQEIKKFIDELQSYGLRFNAEKRFKEIKQQLMSGHSYYDCNIFQILDRKVLGCDNFEFQLQKGRILYRAREISISDYKDKDKGLRIEVDDGNYLTKGYSESESVEVPLGIIQNAGRNNISGMAYLYLADDEITACAEIKSSLRSLISLARFEIETPLKLIDFSRDDKAFQSEESIEENMGLGIFFSLLMLQYCQPVADKDEYRVTQIVSDYIRKAGYDGIAYRSFYTGGTNYTIFNSHKKNVRYIDSRIVSHQFTNEIFWDFNNSKALQSNVSNVEYDVKLAKEILDGMKNTFG